jgi:Ni/Fe-hydrogenase subunit HybB-like protein
MAFFSFFSAEVILDKSFPNIAVRIPQKKKQTNFQAMANIEADY